MTKISIILDLMNKGYNPVADLTISTGDTVYKYTLPTGAIERFYILESNIGEPFWGMSPNVVNRICTTKENFFVILLATNNGESFVVNKKDIVAMRNSLASGISRDKKGNYKLTANEMHKINGIHVFDDATLAEFVREQI